MISSRLSPDLIPQWRSAGVTALSFAAALLLSSCALSTKPSVGAIAFTDANGNPVNSVSAIKAGSGIYLDVVISNDPQLLGVNWSVGCGSELPPGTPLPPGQTVDQSCGFFTPTHTATAPVPSYAASGSGIVAYYTAPAAQPSSGTVTLYASATADPSRFSSITLSILP